MTSELSMRAIAATSTAAAAYAKEEVIRPMTCHERLQLWSKATNETELIHNVLERTVRHLPESSISATALSGIRILEYLESHKAQWRKEDLPNFSGVQNVLAVSGFPEDVLSDLDKKLISMEKSIKGQPEGVLRVALQIAPLFPLVHQYLNLEETLNLYVLGEPLLPSQIEASIDQTMREDLNEFVRHQLRQKLLDDPDTATAMIRAYFQGASIKSQTRFFEALNCIDLSGGCTGRRPRVANPDFFLTHFYSHISHFLPLGMQSHVFKDCDYDLLRDHHIQEVIERSEKLQYLRLESDCLTDTIGIAIASNSNMTHLEELDIAYRITNAAAISIANSTHLINLQRLSLNYCHAKEDVAKAIASNPCMANLRKLRLISGVTDGSVIAIANSCHMRNLKVLDLTNNSAMTDNAMIAIARSSHMVNLQEIRFGNPQVHTAAARAFASSPYMANLQHLDFSVDTQDETSFLTDSDVISLAQSPHMANLQSLNFDGCHLTDHTVMAIANSPYMRNLQMLSLNFSDYLSNSAVIAIANSTHMAGLKTLNLYHCPLLSDEAAKAIASSPYMRCLERLIFSFCPLLTDAAVIAIAHSACMATLHTLGLSGCHLLTDETAKAIGSNLYMSNLQELHFSFNPLMTDAGVRAIFDSPHLKSLGDFPFSHCKKVTIRGKLLFKGQVLLTRVRS